MPTTEANTTIFCGSEIPACGHISPLYHTPFFPACQPFGALDLRPYLISFATKLRFVDDFQLSTLFYYKKLFFLCKYRESDFFVANLPIFVANTTMFLPAEMPQFPAFLTSSFFQFPAFLSSSLSGFPAYPVPAYQQIPACQNPARLDFGTCQMFDTADRLNLD